MEVDNNQNSVSEMPEVEEMKPVVSDVSKNDNVVFNDKPKKNSGMILGMILLIILAIGGIGFGVWAMTDKTQEVAKLNERVAELNNQLLKQESTINADDEDNISTYQNPIIKSDDQEEIYSISFNSSNLSISGQSSEKRIKIIVKDGKLNDCSLFSKGSEDIWHEAGQCDISGLEGNIYKIIEFGEGDDNGNNKIGFIMENGKVAYLDLYDFESSNSVNIKGFLAIEKYVADVLTIDVSSVDSIGGYFSTVFVMSDGSFVRYNKSMLK